MSQDFLKALQLLHLTQVEAARLLDVDARTARRWAEGAALPGPVREAFRGWVRLKKHNLPWRPGSLALFMQDHEKTASFRAKTQEIDAIIAKVTRRGGPQNAWIVDFDEQRALCGSMEVTFTEMKSGEFCLNVFTRRDRAAELPRDRSLIEDAAYCIARAQTRKPGFGPVQLHVAPARHEGKWRVYPVEQYEVTQQALARACQLLHQSSTHAPHIQNETGDTLWSVSDVRMEWKKRKRGEKSESRFVVM